MNIELFIIFRSPDEMSFVFCREVLDSFLRNRAESYGAKVINGLFLRMDVPKDANSPYVIHYSDYAGDSKVINVTSCGGDI